MNSKPTQQKELVNQTSSKPETKISQKEKKIWEIDRQSSTTG